jgi:hypothetical protein
MTVVAQTWWARLRPSTLAWRERDEEPRTWVEFEWLAQMMAEMDRKAGISRSLDPDVLARGLPVAINQMRQAVEIDESLRSVTVRLAPIPIPVTAARPTEDTTGQGARDIHLTS